MTFVSQFGGRNTITGRNFVGLQQGGSNNAYNILRALLSQYGAQNNANGVYGSGLRQASNPWWGSNNISNAVNSNLVQSGAFNNANNLWNSNLNQFGRNNVATGVHGGVINQVGSGGINFVQVA